MTQYSFDAGYIILRFIPVIFCSYNHRLDQQSANLSSHADLGFILHDDEDDEDADESDDGVDGYIGPDQRRDFCLEGGDYEDDEDDDEEERESEDRGGYEP